MKYMGFLLKMRQIVHQSSIFYDNQNLDKGSLLKKVLYFWRHSFGAKGFGIQ